MGKSIAYHEGKAVPLWFYRMHLMVYLAIDAQLDRRPFSPVGNQA